MLATGCLIWLFSEYAMATGQSKYHDYELQCRGALESAMIRLTLFLPATQEVIAALTVGVSLCNESSKTQSS